MNYLDGKMEFRRLPSQRQERGLQRGAGGARGRQGRLCGDIPAEMWGRWREAASGCRQQAALSQHSWNLQLQPACFLFSFLSTLCRIAWVPRPAKHPIPLALFLPTVGLGVGLMGVVPLPASLGSK